MSGVCTGGYDQDALRATKAMENHTLLDGFPKEFHRPYGTFMLRYSDNALAVAKNLGLDMSYLPLQLNTSRAELVEVIRDGQTTEFLHYRVRMGDRDVVLVISMMVRGWLVTNFLEVDG